MKEGFVRKKKLKVKEVWTLPLGERIIVPFDNFDTPSTDAAGLFTGTLAGLAQESSTFPINFTDWRLMPKQYKEDTFAKIIKLKFHFQNDEIAKHWTLQNIGRKWKDFKSRLWIEFYDHTLNRDELISKCPIGIHRDQWSSFVNYRLSEKSKEMCRKNAESRKQQKIAHTCGSKSFARRRAEMEIELGHNVNRSELWIDTHKVKRGSSVNEECRIITEKIINEMEKGSSSQSQSISQDDPLGKTLGKEHNGRVRGLGFGPCPSKVFNNTLRMNDKDYVSTLEKELAATKAQLQVQSDKLQVQSDMQKAMGGALVAILERTFGKVPEEFATFLNQTSQPVPDEGSKQQSSQGSGKQNSSSSHHVNGQSST
ncbi:PREDICTED: uncharacterized protein LOC109146971 [Ipomoea nil]|uniref:uncharacterized protein LOC109146971 n=1 Tax=Ipomoea nil TaxID=35883 RepID=UPI000901559F|nr:PREDICTED: uncharacterized protein LOC109146971 [Ipomoea nil]XP_019150166.1 PREDICTED: uncharacterized protein LOC109146971 [Ipomoea nil]XP_019150167.1 PREDICTED: uncharacterized protein LOC109146971 [Ipomoea nil]